MSRCSFMIHDCKWFMCLLFWIYILYMILLYIIIIYFVILNGESTNYLDFPANNLKVVSNHLQVWVSLFSGEFVDMFVLISWSGFDRGHYSCSFFSLAVVGGYCLDELHILSLMNQMRFLSCQVYAPGWEGKIFLCHQVDLCCWRS